MTTPRRWRRLTAACLALVFVAAACASDDTTSTSATDARAVATTGSNTTTTRSTDSGSAGGSAFGGFHLACSETPLAPASTRTPVKVQLPFIIQAEFAGYIAAAAHDYYKDLGLDVQLLEGDADTVAADPARQRRGRLRHRAGPDGAPVARGRRPHHRHLAGVPALRHGAGELEGRQHHHPPPT